MRPFLDVVICTYNRAASLDRCLWSLARQRPVDADWRVFVIDNNCTDGTPQVVEAHARRQLVPGLVRIVASEQGLTAARLRGVRESTADWIAFVDDDCVLAADWVAAAASFAAANPGAGGFGGRVLPCFGDRTTGPAARNGWLFAEQDHGAEVREVQTLVGAGMVLNRAALSEIGWLDRPFLQDRIGRSTLSGGDVEIGLRLSAAGRTLWYVPGMRLDHVIEPGRYRLRGLLALAWGLGRGAQLLGLMASAEPGRWPVSASRRLAGRILRQVAGLGLVVAGRYPSPDWLIHATFVSARAAQHVELLRRPDLRRELGGACARRPPRQNTSPRHRSAAEAPRRAVADVGPTGPSA